MIWVFIFCITAFKEWCESMTSYEGPGTKRILTHGFNPILETNDTNYENPKADLDNLNLKDNSC